MPMPHPDPEPADGYGACVTPACEVPSIAMTKELTYNATLVERRDLTASLAVFRLALDGPMETARADGASFLPGQYVTVGLNAGPTHAGKALSVVRPMSIASAPEDTRGLEFFIRRVARPESELALTHLLWDLAEGGRLYVRPIATGHFTLEDTVGALDPRIKLFLAAGTGLAPFLSMVRSRAARGEPLQDVVLIHGASHDTELGYRVELEELTRRFGLRYLPTVSRPAESPGWRGSTGRAESLLSPARIEETEARLGLVISPERVVTLVCGLTGTVREAILGLIPRGFIPHHRRIQQALGAEGEAPSIFYEQYDAEPVIDVKDEALTARLRAELRLARERGRVAPAAHPRVRD